MVEYRAAATEQREELLDFANYVFSQAHRPHNFKVLLEKVYGDAVPTEKLVSCHYLALEDGKLRGMVACPVVEGTVCGEPLKIGFVGTVSTHPYARGAGYMKGLMGQMLDCTQDVDLWILGGQRQRYRYFGFEQAGSALELSFTEASLEKGCRGLSVDALEFRELLPGSDWEKAAFALYRERLPVQLRREDNFIPALRSWARTPYCILKNGCFAGYFTSDAATDYYKNPGEETIGELLLTDERLLGQVLLKRRRETGYAVLKLTVFPEETERIHLAEPFWEELSIKHVEMLRVNHWLPVLRAALKLKAAQAATPDTRRVLELDGERICISIQNGKTETFPCEEPPELILAGTEAVHTLFHPVSAVVPALNPMPELLPLPFELYTTDEF